MVLPSAENATSRVQWCSAGMPWRTDSPLGPLSPAETNETATLVLFQPLALGGGVAEAVGAFGADASRLMVTDALLVPPALVAEHVNVVPAAAVSVVMLEGPQSVEDEIDDWGSVTVHVRPTSLVYQPPEPSVPVMFGVITGGVESDGGAPMLIE